MSSSPDLMGRSTLPRLAKQAIGRKRRRALPALIVKKTRLAILAVLIGSPGLASDSGSPPIATDRSAVTASSVVVPAGSLQFENGFAITSTEGQHVVDGQETLLRFGVASKTELRLAAPNYLGQSVAGSGFGDLAMGVKQQLGPTPGGFDASVIVTLSMPTGASAVSSHGYDPSVQVPWSRALSPNWTAAGMLSVYWPTQDGRRNVTGETTFLIDRQLIKAWDAFVEYAGDFPHEGGPKHLVHFGTAYKLTARHQLDFHAGIGLSAAAVDHFIGAGYSFRF
jgi:hypothetical protein